VKPFAALLGTLLAAFLAALVALAARPAAGAEEQPSRSGYAGSETCRECHAELYERWSHTGHALTLRAFAPDVPARPFDGEYFEARGVDQRIGPGPQMRVEGPGGAQKEFPVEIVIGVRRVQMFTTTMPDGRIQVLPVFLEVPTKKWFDYADFIFGGPNQFDIPPDSPNSWYGPGRNFNSRCGACHTTNYDIGYDPDTNHYATSWSERAVSCENCHGPGAAHVVHQRSHAEGPDPIVHPGKLPLERANQVCGSCHAEGERIDPTWLPGEDIFKYVDVVGLNDERHTLADGRARELIHNLVPNMETRCGPISCTQCHDPHGRGIPGDLIRPLTDMWTCTQCHDGYKDDAQVEAHTHHPAGSAGSSCFGCHMPRMIIEGGHGKVFDHTISIPSMRNTRERDLPNACRNCHMTEFPGWEYDWFAKWYPGADERNHRVPLSAAIAAGRAGARGAADLLKPFLQDPEPVYRAGAAFYLENSDVDLRPQLDDPHPMVRRAAVEGVARRNPEALLPLLDSDSAVLRNAAAIALMTKANGRAYEWVRAHPETHAGLRAVFTGLRALRSDRAEIHWYLGMLQEMDGDDAQALVSYRRFLRFYPESDAAAGRIRELEARASHG